MSSHINLASFCKNNVSDVKLTQKTKNKLFSY